MNPTVLVVAPSHSYMTL